MKQNSQDSVGMLKIKQKVMKHQMLGILLKERLIKGLIGDRQGNYEFEK